MKTIVAILFALLVASTNAFCPTHSQSALATNARSTLAFPTTSLSLDQVAPSSLVRQRKSVASVQTMGLFGLGPAEIAIVLVAAAFLLGPQKLAELGKDAGKIAGELKEVPKEFQKGLAEGEAQAAQVKKEMAASDSSKDADKE